MLLGGESRSHSPARTPKRIRIHFWLASSIAIVSGGEATKKGDEDENGKGKGERRREEEKNPRGVLFRHIPQCHSLSSLALSR